MGERVFLRLCVSWKMLCSQANRFLLRLLSFSYLETLFSQSYFWGCLAKSLQLHGFYEVNVVAPKMSMNATLVLSCISGLPGGAKKV